MNSCFSGCSLPFSAAAVSHGDTKPRDNMPAPPDVFNLEMHNSLRMAGNSSKLVKVVPNTDAPRSPDARHMKVTPGTDALQSPDISPSKKSEATTPSSDCADRPQKAAEALRQDKVRKCYNDGDTKSLVQFHEVIDLDKVPEHHEADAGMGGDYIKSFVFGGLDGIVSTFALVAGLGGASATLTTLIAVGLAKVLADAFSMGFGEFTSATAELENALNLHAREMWETENCEEGEVKEMASLYMEKGVSKGDALTMLTVMAKYKDLFVEHMMVMEHGMMPPDDSDRWAPLKQGLVCFIAFVIFGLVPLIGFIIVYLIDPAAASTEDGSELGRILGIAYALTVLTLFVMGVTKSKLTGNPNLLRSGAMMVFNGSFAGGIAYLIGEILTGVF